MTRPLRVLVTVICIMAASPAWTQSPAALERFDVALVALSESMARLESDPAASLNSLEEARGGLRNLAELAGRPELADAVEPILARAGRAVDNHSFTDLGVQTAIIRGALQRALLDLALGTLPERPEEAAGMFARLADVAGLTSEEAEALSAARDGSLAITLLEVGVARRMSERLDRSRELYPSDRDAAYRALADGYGDYLLVYDSPRVPTGTNAAFAAAAQSLVDGDAEAFASRSTELAATFDGLAESASAAVAAREAAAQEQQAEAAASAAAGDSVNGGALEEAALDPAATPQLSDAGDAAAAAGASDSAVVDGSPEGAGDGAATEVASTDAPAGAASDAVAESPDQERPEVAGEGRVAQGESAGAAGDTIGLFALAQAGQQAQVEQPAGDGQAGAVEGVTGESTAVGTPGPGLLAELQGLGVTPSRAQALAGLLQATGHGSLGEVADGAYAAAARVSAAVNAADRRGWESEVRAFDLRFERELGPVLLSLAPELHSQVRGQLDVMRSAQVLRQSDASQLLALVHRAAATMSGESPVVAADLPASLSGLWAGALRPALLLIVAILAFLPLYLLNLAFGGGGNRNWTLVGSALFLLLLPAIYEGMTTLGGIAANSWGAPILDSLAVYSPFTGTLGQIAWSVSTLAAIVLASMGLYGICVQFGLLRSRSQSAETAATTVTHTAAAGGATAVEWDEGL